MTELLFPEYNPEFNLLPIDGVVHYFGKIIESVEAHKYFNQLMAEIPWENDVVKLYGKEIVTKRKVAWFGDENFNYTYSNSTKTALPWTDLLRVLKMRVEDITLEKFNSCLLNLYHDGSEGMSYHSDSEKELEKDCAIASLSFGAERRFLLKHKITAERVELRLESGSLMLMSGKTQEFWKHSLPTTKRVTEPRINLTFRKMRDNLSSKLE